MTYEHRSHRHYGRGWGPPPWGGPPWRGPPFRLSILIGVISVVGTSFAAHDQPEKISLDALAFVLLIAGPIALGFRRKWPVPVMIGIFGVTLAYNLLDYPDGPIYLSLIAAGINAAVRGQRAAAIATLIVSLPSFLWLGPLLDTRDWPNLGEVVAATAWVVGIVACAEMVRSRSERAIEAARTRREETRRRASEERLRIAHELHDVLAHNISLINVQAGVALHLMDERPEQARTALAAIKDASDDALGELRSVLEILKGSEHAPRSPTPALSDLDQLIDNSRAAGLDVSKSIEGQAVALPPNVERAAFRIVQEALTNAVRHAGPARAHVRIEYAPKELVVMVEDDGRGAGSLGTSGRRKRDPRDERAGRSARRRTRDRVGSVGRLPRACPHSAARRREGRAVIRVLVADDQALVRAGFVSLLDAQEDIEVVGEAEDGASALALAREHVPDVVLMDIRMPGLDGLAATKQLASDEKLSGVRIVILTTFDLDEYVFEALRVGASGFLVKNTEPEELVQAVRAVAAGDALLSPGITKKLIAEFALRSKEPEAIPDLELLTDREKEVAALVGEGLSNDEIAERLVVSPATVKTHVSRAMIKLGARDRAQLVVFTYESGLVRPGWLG